MKTCTFSWKWTENAKTRFSEIGLASSKVFLFTKDQKKKPEDESNIFEDPEWNIWPQLFRNFQNWLFENWQGMCHLQLHYEIGSTFSSFPIARTKWPLHTCTQNRLATLPLIHSSTRRYLKLHWHTIIELHWTLDWPAVRATLNFGLTSRERRVTSDMLDPWLVQQLESIALQAHTCKYCKETYLSCSLFFHV